MNKEQAKLPMTWHGDLHQNIRKQQRLVQEKNRKNFHQGKLESTPSSSTEKFYLENFGIIFWQLKKINPKKEPNEAARLYVRAELIASKICSSQTELSAQYADAVKSGRVEVITTAAQRSKCFSRMVDRLMSENIDVINQGS
jgi:hypothetical protein